MSGTGVKFMSFLTNSARSRSSAAQIYDSKHSDETTLLLQGSTMHSRQSRTKEGGSSQLAVGSRLTG